MSDHSQKLENSGRGSRVGLIGFGIFFILVGALMLLISAVTAVLPFLPMPEGSAFPSKTLLLATAGLYGALGVSGIWLGIGSLLCRRWARVLILIASVAVMVCGLISLLSFMLSFESVRVSMQQSMQQAAADGSMPPQGLMVFLQFVPLVMILLIYLIIPGVCAWFYSRRSTRMTCEIRDPKVRWTDRLPVPLLGLVLVVGFMAIVTIGTGIALPVFPLFGTFVSGPLATGIFLFLGAVLAGCAWGLARRRTPFLWAFAGVLVLTSISTTVTLWIHGFLPIYEFIGASEEMMAVLRSNPAMGNRSAILMGPVSLIPVLCLVFYCRRWFGRSGVSDQ